MGRRTSGRETLQENIPFFNFSFTKMWFSVSRQRFLMVLTCSWVSWCKNDTERSRNFFKKQILNPKHAKSCFFHKMFLFFFGANPDRAPTRSDWVSIEPGKIAHRPVGILWEFGHAPLAREKLQAASIPRRPPVQTASTRGAAKKSFN